MMKRILIAAVALALVCGSIPPADAASVVLCASSRESNSASRQINLPGLLNSYVADPSGCVIAATIGDISIFRANGFSESGKHRSLIFNTGVATGTTDFVIGVLPAKSYISQVIFSNSVAAAVTGGVSIGSTANGTNIVAAQAVGASTDVAVPQSAILLPVPSTAGAATTLHMAAVTAWNNVNVTVTVVYAYY
jgi:hypothetical protein